MDRARATRRRADRDLAGELRAANRLEGGHLLVPRLDELWLVTRLLPRREQPVDAVTRIAEDLLHSPFAQPGEQDVGDRVSHGNSSRKIGRNQASDTHLPGPRREYAESLQSAN